MTIEVNWYDADKQTITLDSLLENVNFVAKVEEGGEMVDVFLSDWAEYHLRVVHGVALSAINWSSNVIWPGLSAPTLSTILDSEDLIKFVVFNQKFYGILPGSLGFRP